MVAGSTQSTALLKELQQEQRRCRNCLGGYWIAEPDPRAATHALAEQRDRQSTPWLVLATDGAYRPMSRLGIDDWAHLAQHARAGLEQDLSRCHNWEAETDPDAVELARAKRHDEKTLVVVRFGNGAMVSAMD